jgi:rhamnulose-1-phosphate aldolase/alcohol dehydrogenase
MSDFRPLEELVNRSQRIGSDQGLVVYGGGNTSSKGEIKDHLGRLRKVLWVKGSGADMQYAVDRDYPALYLEELLALEEFKEMDDDLMVDYVTRALVDPTSRRPSIETLLHAFLPARHIDHVHADSICALTNHEKGESATREALGEGFAYVDWIRPGFELSKLVGTLKDHEGVVLAHHGLVVWDEKSDRCYQKTVDAVAKADRYLDSLARRPETKLTHRDVSNSELREILLKLRGKIGKRQILKVDKRLAEISKRDDLKEIVAGGAASADHMLRIRPFSLALDPAKLEDGVDQYRENYQSYFDRHKATLPAGYSSHGNDPKVILYPGVGAITAAPTAKENQMLADISFHTHSVAARVRDCFGKGRTIPESEIFGFDYWPMELFKLKSRPAPKTFEGHIFIVTGAGSGIGRGIAIHLAKNGANLVLADISKDGLDEVAASILKENGEKPHLVLADQSQDDEVERTVAEAISHFGGIDGAVINAGIGVSGTLAELSVEKWNQGLAINLTSAFLLTKYTMAALKSQGMGGSLVYVASKNAFAPGAGFGGYSVSKAGMIQLMRIAALEGGTDGIRANAINPDAVFDHSQLWAGGVREQRAAAHGVKPEELENFYASRNLLHAKVRSIDVAETAAFLLSDRSSRTTGSVIAVDGGVAGAFPR